MGEIKPWGYIHPLIGSALRGKSASNAVITKNQTGYNTMPLFTAEQLAEAVRERDLLLRDLRAELNEHRYGRSASK